MAKGKTATAAAATTPTNPPEDNDPHKGEVWREGQIAGSRGWKGELIRVIRGSMPNATQKEIADEFEKRSGETVTTATISNTLSTKSDDDGQPRTRKSNEAASQPSIFDLQKVFDYCDTHKVTSERLAEQVKVIEELANEVGGIKNLSSILSIANRLMAQRGGK